MNVAAVKEAWKKEHECSKELKDLRKLDQMENYERGKAMQKIYKQVIVDKMMTKY